MARPLRIEFEGAWYHVMNRGAGHRNIYKTDKNRHDFLNLIREINLYFRVECHAYCLMDNHYHLLLHTPFGQLSLAMRHINGLYTQQFNRCQQTDGPLFRGRFKAILIEQDAYLLCVMRYIHFNPVTAKMVQTLNEYTWSSHHQYSTGSVLNPWLKTETILNMLSTRNKKSSYLNFMNEGVDKKTAEFYRIKVQSKILGSKLFIEAKLDNISPKRVRDASADYNKSRPLPSVEDIIKVCACYFKISEKDIVTNSPRQQNFPRKLTMYLCKVLSQANFKRIAEYFNCTTKSAASNCAYRFKQELSQNPTLLEQINNIKKLL